MGERYRKSGDRRMTIFRVVAAILFISGAGFGGALFMNNAPDSLSETEFFSGDPMGALVGEGYDLGKLKLLGFTLYHVEESYVEPGRVDVEKMYTVALQAVERRVATCMFRREEGARMLHVQIGTFQTVTEVPPLTNSASLRRELSKIAVMIKEHVDVDDVSLPAFQMMTLMLK